MIQRTDKGDRERDTGEASAWARTEIDFAQGASRRRIGVPGTGV